MGPSVFIHTQLPPQLPRLTHRISDSALNIRAARAPRQGSDFLRAHAGRPYPMLCAIHSGLRLTELWLIQNYVLIASQGSADQLSFC